MRQILKILTNDENKKNENSYENSTTLLLLAISATIGTQELVAEQIVRVDNKNGMKENTKIENRRDELEGEIVALGIGKVRYAEQKIQTHSEHAREAGEGEKLDKHEYILAIDEPRFGVTTRTTQTHHRTRSLFSIIALSHNRPHLNDASVRRL